MEPKEQITESKVEEIKGTIYDVDIVKTPRYTEEQKESFKAELAATIQIKEDAAVKEGELRAIIDKFK